MDQHQQFGTASPETSVSKHATVKANVEDTLDKLKILEKDRSFRVEKIEQEYKDELRRINAAADTGIASVEEDKRGSLQHVYEVRGQIRALEDTLAAMNNELDTAQYNCGVADQQMRDFNEQ